MCEEPKRPETIVDRHHYEPFAGKAFTVIHRDCSGAFVEAAAVEKHVHRLPRTRTNPPRPDVQVQAVFADRAVSHELISPRLALGHDVLHARRFETIRAPHARP